MSVTNTITDTITISYSGNGKAVSVPVGSYTGSEAIAIETVIPASSTNHHIVVPTVLYASIQAACISSDQAVTVKVNSSTTPTETFALTTKAGVVYASDWPSASPFAHDITDLYVTNAGATDAKFHFRALIS